MDGLVDGMENLITGAWGTVLAVALIATGVALLWRGLRGGPSGTRGLLRSRDGMLGRIEGFRLTLGGLVLIGVGVALVTEARWLLVLSLGIGVVEILESSALIAVWKWDRVRRPGAALRTTGLSLRQRTSR